MSQIEEVHPLIAAYVNTDAPLLTLLRQAAALQEDDPLIASMLAMREAISGGDRFDPALRQMQNTHVPPDSDPDLVILFYLIWAAAAVHGRFAEYQAVVRRARGLACPSTPPEIQSLLLEFEGIGASLQGNKSLQEKYLDQALAVLPSTSTRYAKMVVQRALALASRGRATEMEKQLEQISRRPGHDTSLLVLRIYQAVETVQAEEAARLFALFETKPDSEKEIHHGPINKLKIQLGIYRPGSDDITKLPPWAQSAHYLLARRIDLALEAARAAADLEPDLAITDAAFSGFTLLRAELAAGHVDSALRILRLRHEKGNHSYWDPFFLARAERLKGNIRSMQRHWSRALQSVAKYKAQGRLDLELRLACEIALPEWLASPAIVKRPPTGSRTALSSLQQGEMKQADRLIGKSRSMGHVRTAIRKFADLDQPVLITGETGTGKELAARAVHESGERARRPFVAVNCGAIADSLLESELFGHARGAFTGAVAAHQGYFEQAGQGTLFLDEMADISARLQGALLRILESGEVRPVGETEPRPIACRVIAATNADLAQRVKQGKFRQDLYYRLCRLELRLPPLRERPEDILQLMEHFLNLGRHQSHAVLSEELKAALQQYSWPGNVRELRNEAERMRLVNSDSPLYGLEHFKSHAQSGSELNNVHEWLRSGGTPLRRRERMRELFREHRRLTRQEVARILDIALGTATTDLAVLRREGFIEKIQPTRSPRSQYFILREPDQ